MTIIWSCFTYRLWRERIHTGFAARRMLEQRVAESTASLRDYSDALERSNAELKRLAVTDSLTGIANRRQFMETLEGEVARSRRHGRPLSLLMLDIDHFKQINDRWGHATGDEAIKATALACLDGIRTIDLAARVGGEEFAILLPETPMDAAGLVADRVRQNVAAVRLPREAGEVGLTCSIGVSQLTADDVSLETLLTRADQALYRAKAGGRNRVMLSEANSA
jgi:diguanylate cyclase (GGDEF)-like protein